MSAKHLFAIDIPGRIRLAAVLFKFRLLRCALGFKIAAAGFKCRILRLDEPKALLEDRRRSVLIDQFFEKIKHRRFCPRA